MCPGVIAGHDPIYLCRFAGVGQLGGFQQFHGQHVGALVEFLHHPAEALKQSRAFFLCTGIIGFDECLKILCRTIFFGPQSRSLFDTAFHPCICKLNTFVQGIFFLCTSCAS